MPSRIATAPHFGVFHLNLNEAGMLIAKCLWFRGQIGHSDKSFEFDDYELELILGKQAMHYTHILKHAVIQDRLIPVRIKREIEGQIVPDQTYIEALYLADWLEDCGIYLGEAFEEEYIPSQENLSLKVAMLIKSQQHQQSLRFQDVDLTQNAENIFLRSRVAELEEQLEAQKQQTPAHAPISEKQRGAYLNIIGAMLGLLLGKSPSGKPYSNFDTQQSIIDAIHGTFGEASGLSERNLCAKFAEAKRTLQATTSLI